MSKEQIKKLSKLIKNTETDRAIALNNHQYEYAGNLKKYKTALLAEKEELEKKLLEG